MEVTPFMKVLVIRSFSHGKKVKTNSGFSPNCLRGT